MKRFRADDLTGRHVARKRDGAIGEVIAVDLAVPSRAHPGVWGKTVITIHYQDQLVQDAVGGDATGDLSWFRSHFKVLK